MLGCPTLVIAGSNNNAVPIHHAEMRHDGIVGSQLGIIDGADHELLWTHPDELTRVTDEFLQKASIKQVGRFNQDPAH